MHPGNILLSSTSQHWPGSDTNGVDNANANILSAFLNEKENKLVFLDAGLFTEMQQDDFYRFIKLFQAVIHNEGCVVAKMLIDEYRGGDTEYSRNVLDRDAFERDMGELVDRVLKDGIVNSKHTISSILMRVFGLCHTHHVKLETRYVSVVLALGVVEGLGKRLDPSIDLMKCAAPYIAKGLIKQVWRDTSSRK